MLTQHIKERCQDRNVEISENILSNLASQCCCDTALLLCRFSEIKNDSDKDFYDREESNGDLLFLIVRRKRPVTIFFRRSDQNNTLDGLRVNLIEDISNLF